jgi:periplasmic protein TonB
MLPRRRLPGFSVSAIAHVTVLVVFVLFVHRTDERQASPDPSSTDQADLPQLVWLAVPGDGGGGGSGGNQRPESPRRLQREGRDALSVPSVATPVLLRAAFQPTESAIEQTIAAPVLPLASATLTLPGAIDTTSLSAVSLGPGTLRGAGDRNGGGIGDGGGPGLGAGDYPGAGGLNAGAAGLVLPRILRDVKPQYTSEAMRARVEGAVLVRAIVQADGTVRDVQVLRSLDPVFGLDQAAVNAARQWLFRPGLMAGLPVPVAVTIELSFNLR